MRYRRPRGGGQSAIRDDLGELEATLQLRRKVTILSTARRVAGKGREGKGRRSESFRQVFMRGSELLWRIVKPIYCTFSWSLEVGSVYLTVQEEEADKDGGHWIS